MTRKRSTRAGSKLAFVRLDEDRADVLARVIGGQLFHDRARPRRRNRALARRAGDPQEVLGRRSVVW